jgi:hypothetical protein
LQSEPQRHSGISSFRFDGLSGHCDELVSGLRHLVAGQNLYQAFSEILTRLHQNLRFDYLGIRLLNLPVTQSLHYCSPANTNFQPKSLSWKILSDS